MSQPPNLLNWSFVNVSQKSTMKNQEWTPTYLFLSIFMFYSGWFWITHVFSLLFNKLHLYYSKAHRIQLFLLEFVLLFLSGRLSSSFTFYFTVLRCVCATYWSVVLSLEKGILAVCQYTFLSVLVFLWTCETSPVAAQVLFQFKVHI